MKIICLLFFIHTSIPTCEIISTGVISPHISKLVTGEFSLSNFPVHSAYEQKNIIFGCKIQLNII